MIREPLWTGAEVALAMGAPSAGKWFAQGVATDSREVMVGDLFVALEGADTDGHRFVGQALDDGAVAAVVSRPVPELDGDPRLVRVDNTARALEALGQAARDRVAARIVGVTGSVGKTGVKDAIHRALGRLGRAHASIKSFNNHVGVPLSLARMPRDVDFGVFELGMNAPGEIAALSALVRPDVAVITTVGAAHLENFDDEAGIADAKAEIFGGLAPDGTAVINLDNAHADRLIAAAKAAGAARIVTASLEGAADVRAVRLADGDGCTCITADVGGTVLTYKVGLPGRHWALNSLLVLAAIDSAGGDLSLAGLTLGEMAALPGRGARTTVVTPDGAFTLIDESYNANPLSMRAALEALAGARPGARGRRIAILADMAELGDRAEALHVALADALASAADIVLGVGPHTARLAAAAHVSGEVFADAETLCQAALETVRPGDVVMVKGANVAGLTRVVERLSALDRGGAGGSGFGWAGVVAAAE